MSLYGSLYSAITGLNTNGVSMSIIGDNLANINTIGYKRARASFQDMMAYPVIGAGRDSLVGRGAMLEDVEQLFNQGSFMNTGNGLDLAINGNGFFIVNGNVGGQETNFFTRDGQFHVDKDGYMTTMSGLRLQGYMADAAGNIGSTLGDIQFNGSTSPVSPTTEVSLTANLNFEDEAIVGGFDPTDPDGTSNFSTSISVYDALGGSHNMTVYFSKSDTNPNQWAFNAMLEDGTTAVASGTINFTDDGKLLNYSPSSFNLALPGPAGGQNISFDFGDPMDIDGDGTADAAGGTGLLGITNFASTSNLISQSQDGYPPGDLFSLNIDEDGLIVGSFTNGQKRTLGSLALADFNGAGLRRMGSNLWQSTTQSGEPNIGFASTGTRGAINSSVLEQSNVDMASEFVNMIVAQRGYQANSRTITTADQLMQEAINMKR